MKTSLIISLLISSFSVFAIPANTDRLVQELLTNNAEFKALVLEEKGFESVNVERVAPTEALRQSCQNMSRSGSFLEVKLARRTMTRCSRGTRCGRPSQATKSFYFSTTHNPQELYRCN